MNRTSFSPPSRFSVIFGWLCSFGCVLLTTFMVIDRRRFSIVAIVATVAAILATLRITLERRKVKLEKKLREGL